VTTVPDETHINRSRDGKWLIIMGEETIQHPLHRSNMDLISARVRKRNAVGGSRMLMQQQALHDTTEVGQRVGQISHMGYMLHKIGEQSRRCVIRERLRSWGDGSYLLHNLIEIFYWEIHENFSSHVFSF
jgi:hypothetical protein